MCVWASAYVCSCNSLPQMPLVVIGKRKINPCQLARWPTEAHALWHSNLHNHSRTFFSLRQHAHIYYQHIVLVPYFLHLLSKEVATRFWKNRQFENGFHFSCYIFSRFLVGHVVKRQRASTKMLGREDKFVQSRWRRRGRAWRMRKLRGCLLQHEND